MRAFTFHATALFIVVTLGGLRSYGQTQSSPEAILDLNQGIHEYLQGQFYQQQAAGFEQAAQTHYEAAIGRFCGVLEREPDHAAARLFRALAHGQIALLEQDGRSDQRNKRTGLIESREMLREETRLQERRERLAELDRHLQLKDSGLSPAEQFILEREQGILKGTLEDFDLFRTQDLEGEIRRTSAQIQEISRRERDHYEQMLADVRVLARSLKSPEVVVGLLEVIARTKMARLDELQAFDLKEGLAPGGASAEQLRHLAEGHLEQAARVLEAYLQTGPVGEDATRIRFFLGVIRFRQAVPQRARNEAPRHDDRRLGQAEELMKQLAGSDQIEKRWRSYAELYLGLIATERGKYGTDLRQRQAAFEEARTHLNQAGELDAVRDDKTNEWESASSYVIPEIIARQRPVLEQLEKEPAQLLPQFRNDFQLSVYTGAHRDTNVVLLGDRTDMPRGISNPRDFGFTLGTALDYIGDLGRWDHRLARWTVGVQGRVRQLWHVRVDEFDEQDYGGSVALQYEVMPEKDGLGPLLARVQYDYDYVLLGRDAFVEIQSVTPNLRLYALKRRAATDLYFTYSIRDYREPLYDRRYDRDGDYDKFGFTQSLKTVDLAEVYKSRGIEPWGLPGDETLVQDDPDYPARYLTPFIGLEYEWDATYGDEFDQKAYVLTCGADVPLPYGLSLDATAQFEWQDYAHGSLIDFHRRGRSDFIQRYSVGVSRSFVLRGGDPANRYELAIDRVLLTIRADASWTLDDSNVVDRLGQAIFEYDRVIYGLTFAFTFN
jgi:hypothetical protein